MSNEIEITVKGWVGQHPKPKVTRSGGAMTTLRVGSTPRRVDASTGEWGDAETSWFSVLTFGELAENVARSLRKGDPVILRGRYALKRSEYEGRQRVDAEIVANAIGPDLNKGSAVYAPTLRRLRAAPDDARGAGWPSEGGGGDPGERGGDPVEGSRWEPPEGGRRAPGERGGDEPGEGARWESGEGDRGESTRGDEPGDGDGREQAGRRADRGEPGDRGVDRGEPGAVTDVSPAAERGEPVEHEVPGGGGPLEPRSDNKGRGPAALGSEEPRGTP